MKKDQLLFNIGRYDHYYDSVNNKGQFYLGLNTFIIGGLGAAFAILKDQKICSVCLNLNMILLLAMAFLSVFYTLKAILPYLKSGTKQVTSLIFFGSVSTYTQHEFLTKAKGATEDDLYQDLLIQTHELATGLSLKFRRLKYAGICTAIEFILLIPFLILFFINLK
jgi:hypothetical protein